MIGSKYKCSRKCQDISWLQRSKICLSEGWNPLVHRPRYPLITLLYFCVSYRLFFSYLHSVLSSTYKCFYSAAEKAKSINRYLLSCMWCSTTARCTNKIFAIWRWFINQINDLKGCIYCKCTRWEVLADSKVSRTCVYKITLVHRPNHPLIKLICSLNNYPY